MKASVTEFRNQKDFRYGSFDVYVRKNEVIISGMLKKSGSRSRYMLIRRE